MSAELGCAEVKAKSRLYLDDLMPEELRSNIRGHLRMCADCQHYLTLLGSFTIDLKQLLDLEIPEAFQTSMQSKMLRGIAVSVQESKPEKPVSFLSVLGWCFLFTAFGAGVLFFASPFVSVRPFAGMGPAGPKVEILGRDFSAQESPVTPLDHPKEEVEQASKLTYIIRPLHWDFWFPDEASRAAFIAESQPSGEVLYRSDDFLVLNLTRRGLADFVQILKSRKVRLYNGVIMKTFFFNDFSGTVRASFSMDVPGTKAAKSLSRHWHFRFELPNRFNLKEALEQEGVRFNFENPEVWILEIPDGAMPRIQRILRSFHGIQLDPRWFDDAEAASSSGLPTKAAIYIEEG